MLNIGGVTDDKLAQVKEIGKSKKNKVGGSAAKHSISSGCYRKQIFGCSIW